MRRRTLLVGAGALTGAALVSRVGALADTLSPSPTATTTAGKIRGSIEANGILAFKGVPYGADTSTRRFLPPVPPPPWSGTRECLTLGPIAPQQGYRGRTLSEDCLHLNVWTPAVRDGAKRPVLVWFHPGAYSSGTSNEPSADGARLSRRGDAVVVTVNHRLNAFGYLYLAEFGAPEYADSGNAGMLDLILALEWVRDNIAEFGGDSGLVTIFGQSGGGAKCATLMAMPRAHGLFRRVWTMSGQQITASRPATAVRNASDLLAALQLSPNRVRELTTFSMQDLIKVSRAPKYLGPVKDGRALPRDPFDPDAPPLSADIPMVLGNTRDETRNLIGRGDPSVFELTWDTLQAKLEADSPFMGDLDRGKVIAEYRRLYPHFTAADVFFASTTASRSWRGQVIEAERRAVQPRSMNHTWVYQLDWGSPIDGGKWKAFHGLDVPLVFDSCPLVPQAVGTAPAAQRVADHMSEALLAFARNGNPNTTAIPPWPPYDLTRRATMSFDLRATVVDDPRGDERRMFEKVPYVQPGT